MSRSIMRLRGTEELFISDFLGSYDQTAKLLDMRTNTCVQTVEHGAPIEDVIMFPSGTIFMTAGGL